MAAAPPIKFYDDKGTYQGSTHDYPIAALAVSFYGDGATVRLGHAKRDIVFVQGRDGDAGDCFDLVGEAIGNAQIVRRYNSLVVEKGSVFVRSSAQAQRR